jgi:hypothetical protein
VPWGWEGLSAGLKMCRGLTGDFQQRWNGCRRPTRDFRQSKMAVAGLRETSDKVKMAVAGLRETSDKVKMAVAGLRPVSGNMRTAAAVQEHPRECRGGFQTRPFRHPFTGEHRPCEDEGRSNPAPIARSASEVAREMSRLRFATLDMTGQGEL